MSDETQQPDEQTESPSGPEAEATPEATPAPPVNAEEPQPEPEAETAPEPVAETTPEPTAEEPQPEPTAETTPEPSAEATPPAEPEPVAAPEPAPIAAEASEAEEEDDEPAAPRVKPSVPGAHLEVDIVPEGVDPLSRGENADPYAVEEEDATGTTDESEEPIAEPIASAAIDLAAGARYTATGKRKTAIARVILRPGKGEYLVNGRTLEQHFPRATLQRNIRQPLETVGYEARMDVIARLQGGGISAQAGALRHGISRALLEADPNLRGELKRRGFLTRDSRAKERKKAGLKKARKRPQFSKR